MINDWGFTHLKRKQINVINVQNVSNRGGFNSDPVFKRLQLQLVQYAVKLCSRVSVK